MGRQAAQAKKKQTEDKLDFAASLTQAGKGGTQAAGSGKDPAATDARKAAAARPSLITTDDASEAGPE